MVPPSNCCLVVTTKSTANQDAFIFSQSEYGTWMQLSPLLCQQEPVVFPNFFSDMPVAKLLDASPKVCTLSGHGNRLNHLTLFPRNASPLTDSWGHPKRCFTRKLLIFPPYGPAHRYENQIYWTRLWFLKESWQERGKEIKANMLWYWGVGRRKTIYPSSHTTYK